MDVKVLPSFAKSFKRVFIDSRKPWKWVFWENLYYDVKMYIWSIFTYHKVVKKMVPWDGSCIYEMTKFQLEILLPRIENGHEEEISRLEKVKKIKRFIELIDNYQKENYSDRCGYDHNFKHFLVENVEEDGHCSVFRLDSDETEEQRENNQRAFLEGIELRKKEFIEMGELFKEIPGWWD